MTTNTEFRGRETAAELLTLDALQAALARCMAVHPPEGAELRLHKDANRMADLFGLMVYQRVTSVALADIEAGILDAYRRWDGG